MNDISSEKLLDDWILSGKNEIYSRLEKKYDSCLHLTSKSILGVMLAKYSMVTTTEKRIRFFGGDHKIRSSLDEINGLIDGKESIVPSMLVIADDICGGIFAINNGFVKKVSVGNVMFLPYSALCFEDLGIGHADFVHWCMTCSYNDWLMNGWKTSENEFIDYKKADEYILAKLTVLKDLRGEENG